MDEFFKFFKCKNYTQKDNNINCYPQNGMDVVNMEETEMEDLGVWIDNDLK
jgi:hypothetical protein